ncbi:efflux RND transporter periplasmic adaptor subunit [Mangrovitalea sediminis]|uniref:efflux RND transporter periplasmic adaptor subunit n=1 Tax=Mangrovitalea sediminis TaxID=1982043 RepID=UPI000BE51083|nr:efflux RND transporter periplasmic adaptor subunit [Mangrovitalea sediminis]
MTTTPERSNRVEAARGTRGAHSPVKGRAPRNRGLRWLIVGVILVLAVGAGVTYRLRLNDASPHYALATVTRGNIEKTVTALGSIKPKDYVDVGVQVSGQLQKIWVAIGDRVSKGQLLAEIDPKVYETRVSTDKANMASLKAQLLEKEAALTLARQQYNRNLNLFKENAVSQDTLQTSHSAVKVAQAQILSYRAQIDSAQAALDGDEASLGYTKIYAPMSGTVVTEPAVEGQTLNANQTTPTILEIANLDTMTVWAQVAEADINRLKVGMPVYFTTLGMPDQRWHATVRQILPTPETVNDVILYDVLIDIANPNHVLMSSMTAQVFFVLGAVRDVPVVPVSALHYDQEGGKNQAFVMVMTAQGPRRRLVDIGLQNRTEAEVKSGLQPGDKVIVGELSATAASQGRRRFGMGPHL